jgi:hypothetical protein
VRDFWRGESLPVTAGNFSVADSAGPKFAPLAASSKVWPRPNFGQTDIWPWPTQKTVHSEI